MLPHQDVASARVAAVARAIESMRAGLADPRSLADLARAGRYSPFHFHRIFREVTTVTPARFLAALRMAEARRLLVRSALTVTEISRLVGYQSLGTFTTQFGRLVGLAPHQFRQLMRLLREEPVGALFSARPADAHPGDASPADARPADAGQEGPADRGWCLLTLSGAAPWPALVVGGLCPAGSLSERPGWWATAAGTTRMRLPVMPGPGDYSAFVVVVPAEARLTEAFLDERSSGYLIGVARIRLSSRQDQVAVPVTLRGPRPTDPPVLAVAPLRWLARSPAPAPVGRQPATVPRAGGPGRSLRAATRVSGTHVSSATSVAAGDGRYEPYRV